MDKLEEQQNGAASTLMKMAGDVGKITASMDLNDDDYDTEDVCSEVEGEAEAEDVLLIGDDILHDVESTSDKLTCVSIADAMLCNVRKHLKSVNNQRVLSRALFPMASLGIVQEIPSQ